ncbi:MAG: hypothetical protein HYY11_03065 [Candidatus Methylomirabilis oxyfera]|nr:hypothetical protein [Candidatus Methylomirabilis oxyfera]
MARGTELLLKVLEKIAEAGERGTTQAALAHAAATSEASISRVVAVLEAYGYAEPTALGVRLGMRCGELWRAYRRNLKLQIAAAEASLRATEITGEANGEGAA